MPSPSGQTSQRSRSSTILGLSGLALVAGLVLAGCSAASAGGPSAATAPGTGTAPGSSSAASPGMATPIPIDGPGGGPGGATTGSGSAASSTGTVSAGPAAAIEYPYPGTSGIAPDHTIVVVGDGSASVASGASDAARASAERTALVAALADARSGADAIAGAAHVTIDGVLSVSASRSPYAVYPMGVEVPAAGTASPGALAPGALPPAASMPQGPTVVTATVTVAYTIH